MNTFLPFQLCSFEKKESYLIAVYPVYIDYQILVWHSPFNIYFVWCLSQSMYISISFHMVYLYKVFLFIYFAQDGLYIQSNNQTLYMSYLNC